MVYLNGEIVENDKATVSVYDHGLLYGDGVFEGIRIYRGKVFRLDEHIDRLFASAKAIMLDIGMSRAMMKESVLKTVTASCREEGYIRLVVTRGPGTLGIDPAKCKKPNVVIIVDGIELYPAELYEKGISVITAATRRMSVDSLDPRVKSLNYLNNILGKLEAKQAGCMEAVMLNSQGRVAECTADNVFAVQKGRVLTPPAVDGALEGITRQTILDICTAGSVPYAVQSLTRYDLYTADEIFLTGSGAEIVPVVSVDSRVVGDGKPGPVTGKLRTLFTDYITQASGSNL